MIGRNIRIPEAALADFCRKWKIAELALFGSVLRDDYRPDSDVDVLVTFAEGARWTLFDMVDMRDELSRLMGRPVDLVTRGGVQRSRNYLRRQAILSSAETIYVQR